MNFNKKKTEEEKENALKGSFMCPKAFQNVSQKNSSVKLTMNQSELQKIKE